MPATDNDEALRLISVSFRYADQSAWALQDVSVQLRRGEMLVIMGATGAGKSTLAKCFNRIVPAFQPGELRGEIRILGSRLQAESVSDVARRVGLVSQDFESQLFATNVVQEIAFGMEQAGIERDEMHRRVVQALGDVGLSGFDGRDPSTLSGGEKQRLAIAAMLALEPAILVFDEPTTDLDPLGKLEIFELLSRMRRDKYALVVIEHETTAAELADAVMILGAGRVIAHGTPARILGDVDLLERHGVRPPDLSRLSQRLRWTSPPADIEAAAERLRPLWKTSRVGDAAQTAPSSSPAAAPLSEVVGVDFRYESGQVALRNVSLSIRSGEFIALIGQNGSGKTTLAKLLNGLLCPTRGKVALRGADLQGLSLNQIAHDVGYVFQNPDHQIFAASIFDEVAFGPRNLGCSAAQSEARVAEALSAVGLSEQRDEDPFLLGKGQRQRLAVASILAMRPKLLILDEPTTGLDYREQQRMMALIRSLHDSGMAIVMITHSPWVVAEYAQRAVLMRAGEICFDGSLRALFADEALLAAAHFRVPDATRLGNRLGHTMLSVDELLRGIGPL